MRALAIALGLLSIALGLVRPQSAPPARVTDLFSAREKAHSGIAKLTPSEVDSLNAAFLRVLGALMASGPSSTMPRSTGSDLDLFDSQGKVVAYLDPAEELTFYLWNGEPVAYLDDDSIYGFNGTHLGWYVSGIVYDGEGNVLAAPASAFRTPVSPSGPRGFKRFKPFKAFKAFKPFKPFLGTAWSKQPALVFFARGTR